jgi:hypothetical protein
MKYVLILLFTLFTTLSYGQISLELIGGVGFDINKFETKYTNNQTPLTHSYTYNGVPNDVEFTILEPQNVGGRFLWKFSKKMDLSVGLEGQFQKRNIIGTFYSETNPNFNKMDINIRQYLYGIILRKEINLNDKNKLFIQPGLYGSRPPGGLSYFSTNEGIEGIAVKNRQLIQYKEGEEYYNLIQIDPFGGGPIYRFTQGYLMNISPKFTLGISNTIHFETVGNMDFLIWAWNDDLQRKAGFWTPYKLKFTSVMFDLFLVYEF